MGCGSSRLCTPEQQDAVFESGAKEMLLRCIENSVATTDSIDRLQIPLPPEVDRVRQLSVSLKKVSSMAKDHLTTAKGGVGLEDAAKRASAEGGMLQGLGGVEKALFGTAASLVDKAAEAVGAGIGMAAARTIALGADGLEQSISDIQGPFNFASRGFLWKSKLGVIKIYSNAIDKLKLQRPVHLVRGEHPHGPAQYKACPPDSLSSELCKQMAGELEESLTPLAIDIIARNKTQDDWDSLMWKYNQALSNVKAYVQQESFQQIDGAAEVAKSLPDDGPIEFDMVKYIVKQTVQQLAALMGSEEAQLRTAEGKLKEGRKPANFHLCFSADLDGHLTLGKRLPYECYDSRDK